MESVYRGQYLQLQFTELVERMPPTLPYNFERCTVDSRGLLLNCSRQKPLGLVHVGSASFPLEDLEVLQVCG
jgi:hypothetical protein